MIAFEAILSNNPIIKQFAINLPLLNGLPIIRRPIGDKFPFKYAAQTTPLNNEYIAKLAIAV